MRLKHHPLIISNNQGDNVWNLLEMGNSACFLQAHIPNANFMPISSGWTTTCSGLADFFGWFNSHFSGLDHYLCWLNNHSSRSEIPSQLPDDALWWPFGFALRPESSQDSQSRPGTKFRKRPVQLGINMGMSDVTNQTGFHPYPDAHVDFFFEVQHFEFLHLVYLGSLSRPEHVHPI